MIKVNFIDSRFHEIINKPSESSQAELVRFNEIVQNRQVINKSLCEHAITYLNDKELQLDEKIHNHVFQNKIDQIGRYIEAKFSFLKEFNAWLDSNGKGKWYTQLALCLAKLPGRAVRNIIRLLYSIIKGLIYFTVHPLKASLKLAKLLVRLSEELTKPETWSKIGVGSLGASCGQMAIAGSFLSPIGIGIGAALTIGGLSFGALKAACEAEKGTKLNACKKNLLFQLKQLPEVALTSFCMSLILGAIQKVIKSTESSRCQPSQASKNLLDPRALGDEFIKQNQLPQYSSATLDPSGKFVILRWKGSANMDFFRSSFPNQFHPQWMTPAQSLEINLAPAGSTYQINFAGMARQPYHGYGYEEFTLDGALDELGLQT